jgi:excisionase family DNA binding protein
MEKLFTIKQVGDEFGISRSTIYRANKAGHLPFVKFGRASRIRQSDALKWIASLPVEGDRPQPSH